MTGPVRVQRSRPKGSRLPEGAIVVTRPGRFGNPFGHDGTPAGRALAVAQFVAHLRSRADSISYPSDDVIREALAGRDLACWCPLDGPCHADELLRIANTPVGRGGHPGETAA